MNHGCAAVCRQAKTAHKMAATLSRPVTDKTSNAVSD
jgi:hypothetical protein